MRDLGNRVLVVDDDEDLRRILVTRLRGAGFDVVEAADGYGALQRIRAEPFDVVVLDIMMPRLDGYSVLERIREEEPAPAILFLSARGKLEDRVRGLSGGAVDYVTKPFHAAELVARVEAAARRKRELEEARIAMDTDAMTGLANRRRFERSLTAELTRASRYGRPLALVYLDVNGLKEVNDTWGHEAGDAMLHAVSHAIQDACRETDLPCRIGGDEFAIVLPETDREQTEYLRERLCESLANHSFEAGESTLAATASIGVAVFPEDAADENGLRRAADAELYREKKTDRLLRGR